MARRTRSVFRRGFAVGLALAALTLGTACEKDGGDGASSAANSAEPPGPPGPWTRRLDGVVSTAPAAAEGVLYVTTSKATYALDGPSGAQRWKFPLQKGGHTAPAIADGTVYTGDEYTLYGVDAASGQEKWRFALPDKPYPVRIGSPSVVGGVIYMYTAATNGNNVLRAFDAATRAEKWSYDTGSRILDDDAPTVVDGQAYAIGADGAHGTVTALDAASGTKKWSFYTRAWPRSQPYVAAGTVHVTSADNTIHGLYAIDAQTGRAKTEDSSTEADWVVADDTGIYRSVYESVEAVDAAERMVKWRLDTGLLLGDPALADGALYFVDNEKDAAEVGGFAYFLRAVDTATGKEKWRARVPYGGHAPAVSGGYVYVVGHEARIIAIDAATGQSAPAK
ncbi:outer membrane protein assembly factor BamB family protein [Yinghuangia soli]|uniref:PQQ-binding-like beta-propeller repeat protein n=1 Tax=Yinghuangia soli TaxID=2908204 RepID=A0AA41Q2Q8_9ACTN|nr:PQQ-binding-like beta-propeller repeat protein [Yinghuangia soli]MCF2530483.1 PQQ-binding-like beta-propeller repeat protein [Yinghuangia soli]